MLNDAVPEVRDSAAWALRNIQLNRGALVWRSCWKCVANLSSASTSHDQAARKRQTDATDQQIDQLVYALYGLTEEEIKIVETPK